MQKTLRKYLLARWKFLSNRPKSHKFLPKTINRVQTLLLDSPFLATPNRNSAVNYPIRPKSHPVSRRLRSIFEFKPARTIFGLSLALATILIALGNPSPASSDLSEPVLEVISVPLELSTQNSFQYPLERPIIVNQGFHSWHPGVDLKGYLGDPIHPIMPGIVTATNHFRYAYGNHVIVQHGQGLISLYAHMNKIYAQEGQHVGYQDVLGEVGTTGHSTGPHLHLEVTYQGNYLNPMSLLEK